MEPKDLTKEQWREYDFGGRSYRIDGVTLWIGETTHRIWDGVVVHCVPAPGVGDCVLRWKPKDAADPIQF